MVKTVYRFDQCVKRQEQVSDMFERWLSSRPKVAKVIKAGIEDDMQGIDYILTTSEGNTRNIQLKVDFKADYTGNIPVEVVSQAYIDKNGVIGSAFKMSRVDYMFFILMPSCRIIGFKFKPFLEYVTMNYERFRNFRADNGTYQTLGFLVPLDSIDHLLNYDECIST